MFKNTPNLVVYYKLTDAIYKAYDSVKTTQYIDFTSLGYVNYDYRNDYFNVDCAPGMSGSIEGCQVNQNWTTPKTTTNTKYYYDLSPKIKNKANNRDL